MVEFVWAAVLLVAKSGLVDAGGYGAGMMNMRMRSMVAAASVASSVLVTAPASHADSAPPCGTVITTDLLLTTDMYCPNGAALIVGGASGITVDLGGHHLVGGGTTFDFSSGVVFTGNGGVTVMNGTIRGFDLGVFGAGGRGDGEPNTLTGLRLSDNRLGFAGWSGARARLSHNRIDANRTGISFVSNARGTVVDNLIEDNESCGVGQTEASGNVYTGNVIRNNGGCGISSFIGGGTIITGNRISGHAVGVSLGHVHSRGNQVTDNEVFDNGVGVRIGGTSADQVDRTLISRNRFVNNRTAGLLFATTLGSAADSTISENVFVRTATGDGLYADIAPGTGDVTVRDNVAVRNGDYGIEAVGVVDGGGNHARANGNALQCVGVAC